MRHRAHAVVTSFVLACAFGALSAQAVPITIYEDLDLSGDYGAGEERTGGVNGNGGAAYDYAFDLDAATQDISAATIQITFRIWDNGFLFVLNGVTVVPLDPNDPAVFNPAIVQPWNANINGIPRLRTTLGESAIAFEAALTAVSTAITSGLVYAQTTINPVFADGQNTITIINPNGPGPDALDFTISGDVPILIPEPASAALMGLGLLCLGLQRRRRPTMPASSATSSAAGGSGSRWRARPASVLRPPAGSSAARSGRSGRSASSGPSRRA